jgi:hypothetical protein
MNRPVGKITRPTMQPFALQNSASPEAKFCIAF